MGFFLTVSSDNSSEKRTNQNEKNNNARDDDLQSIPTSPNPKSSAEGKFLDRMSMIRPSGPEPDMRQTDAHPREQRREPPERQQPRKHRGRTRAEVNVRDTPKEQGDEETDERSALAVDVGQEAGRLAVRGESSEGSRGGERRRVADGENGDEDDGIEDGWKACRSEGVPRQVSK